MINNVQNIANVNAVQLTANGKVGVKSLPAINSFVNIEVLEKMNNGFKILVDGKLFQSKLPVNLSKGDEVFAKVVSHRPFTLGLDNFVPGGKMNAAHLALVLAKLGIKETALSKSVIKNIAANGKPLVKSKLQRLIEYMEVSDITLDEMQMTLLINIIWNDNKDNYKGSLDSFAKIFDVTFEELSRQIFLTILKINDLDYPNELYRRLNDYVIYQLDEAHNNVIALKDKSNSFLNIAEFTKTLEPALDMVQRKELEHLKKYMLKYVLQKALYGRFDYNPEFAIIKGKKSLELFNYDLNMLSSGDITTYNINANSFESVYGELSFSFMINESSCRGKIIGDSESLTRIKGGLEKMKTNISKKINNDIDLVLQTKGNKQTSIGASAIKSIDFQV